MRIGAEKGQFFYWYYGHLHHSTNQSPCITFVFVEIENPMKSVKIIISFVNTLSNMIEARCIESIEIAFGKA